MSTLDKITTLLKQQHKKQVDLTNYLGVSKNLFTNWKIGHSSSYKRYISKIAEFLGVSTDYLLEIEEQVVTNVDEAEFTKIDTNTEILERILLLLKEQHKTQKELAEYLGMTKSAFSGWKSRSNTSYKKYIGQIAIFFDVSVDYLLGNTNIRNSKVSGLTEDEKEFKELYELVELYKCASPSLRNAAMAVLRSSKK